MSAPSSFMLSVLSDTTCIGFVLERGKAGHEAFTANERSLGLFDNQRAAADAVINAAGNVFGAHEAQRKAPPCRGRGFP